MDQTLTALISELKTKSSMNVKGEQLPDEQTVEKIGRTGSPEAIPHLEEALRQAKRFKALCEKLQTQMASGEAGSASPFLAAMLAEQSIRALQAALAKCRQPVNAEP